jgi:hypothetical protein
MKEKTSEGGLRYWMRVLRPLAWWVLLVLVLYGIRTHQRLMQGTRIEFSISLAEQPMTFDASAKLDGQPVATGQNITLGQHTFTISHPKTESFQTNFFAWYGLHDFGEIKLNRSFGGLNVQAIPPAPVITITGPEFSTTLYDSSGTNLTVPTDSYTIQAEYPHWSQSQNTAVYKNAPATCLFAPHFGGLQLDCNQSDATFQLQRADGQVVSKGVLPVTITGLPAGDYTLNAVHHGHQRTETVTVTANTTNDTQCDFQYGAVVIETSPVGVAVLTQNGRDLGETPLTLIEMLPGTRTYTLQRSGYQSIQVSLDVVANQTNFIGTNLVSETYLHALTKARQYMADADYDDALLAAGDALTAKPNDVEAATLQNEASGLGHLQRAKILGHTNDYIGGGKELALALQALPDNKEIKELILSYKQQEPAQIERERVERLARPKKVFDDFLTQTKDAELFDSHELTTSRPVKDVAAAIVDALEQVQPTFKVTGDTSPEPETYVIYANQTDANIISTTGRRQCMIVCGQARDDETQIYFKVMEYKTKHNVSMPGLLAFRDDMEFIPIHPSTIPDMTDKLKAQVQTGVSNLTVRIQGAIGQTTATPPATPQ